MLANFTMINWSTFLLGNIFAVFFGNIFALIYGHLLALLFGFLATFFLGNSFTFTFRHLTTSFFGHIMAAFFGHFFALFSGDLATFLLGNLLTYLAWDNSYGKLQSNKNFEWNNQSVWKSHKKSHSTLRAKRATFTFEVDKSWLKMPKIIKYSKFLKIWSLRSNSVTREFSNNFCPIKSDLSGNTVWL